MNWNDNNRDVSIQIYRLQHLTCFQISLKLFLNDIFVLLVLLHFRSISPQSDESRFENIVKRKAFSRKLKFNGKRIFFSPLLQNANTFSEKRKFICKIYKFPINFALIKLLALCSLENYFIIIIIVLHSGPLLSRRHHFILCKCNFHSLIPSIITGALKKHVRGEQKIEGGEKNRMNNSHRIARPNEFNSNNNILQNWKFSTKPAGTPNHPSHPTLRFAFSEFI